MCCGLDVVVLQMFRCWRLGPHCGHIGMVGPLRGGAYWEVLRSAGGMWKDLGIRSVGGIVGP